MHHPDLVSAAEKVNQTKAAKEVTRGAAMPMVTGTASELTAKNASNSTSSSAGRNTTYTYGGSVQQLLFDGFKTSYGLSTAERNIRANRYNYDVTSSNIRLRLRTAYSNLLSAQELLKVTEEIVARRKQDLELVKLRYEGGSEHKGSLLTSEADLAQAVYDVNNTKRNILLAQRQLVKELGRTKFSPLAASGELGVKEEVREMPDFEKVANDTPLLQQLIEQKEAAKFGLSSATAQFFPQIYATGGLNNTGKSSFPDQNQWSVGTNLTLPIFDYANTFANVSKARAALGQAAADERSGRDGVIVTLANTWITLQNTIDNVIVQNKVLTAAQERARIAKAEYAIGLLSYDNWIIIENNLVSAKKSFVNAELNALIAEANWIQAKGGTLDYD